MNLRLIALCLGSLALPVDASGISAKLLLSSDWCSFRYNQHSGHTSQTRVQFRNNGSWVKRGQYESYSSGAAGTYAGQSNSGSGGRWKMQGSRLLMSEGNEPLEAVDARVTYNSNGYPIIVADGVEYSQCR